MVDVACLPLRRPVVEMPVEGERSTPLGKVAVLLGIGAGIVRARSARGAHLVVARVGAGECHRELARHEELRHLVREIEIDAAGAERAEVDL